MCRRGAGRQQHHRTAKPPTQNMLSRLLHGPASGCESERRSKHFWKVRFQLLLESHCTLLSMTPRAQPHSPLLRKLSQLGPSSNPQQRTGRPPIVSLCRPWMRPPRALPGSDQAVAAAAPARLDYVARMRQREADPGSRPLLLLAPMENLADRPFRRAIASTAGGFDESCTGDWPGLTHIHTHTHIACGQK